jgi:hypothetical protein
MIAVYGIAMLLGILYVVFSGLKGKQPKGHKVISFIVLIMALIHALSGWLMRADLIPLLFGSALVIFFGINILSGMQIIKMSPKSHRIIGHIVLWVALSHAIGGVIGYFVG